MKRFSIAVVALALVLTGCITAKKRLAHKVAPPPPLPPGLKLSVTPPTKLPTRVKPVFVPSFVPTDFALISVRTQAGNRVVLTWINGTPPFQPQSKLDVLSGWSDFGPSTMQRSVTNFAPYGFTRAFFRVRSGSQQPDVFPPTTSLTSPANGSTVSNVTTLTASASDDIGVTLVEFYLDGSVLLGSDPSAPYSFQWDTTSLPNGVHFLSSRAYDSSGKTSNSTFIIVTINNFSPYTGTCTWSKRFGGTSGHTRLPRDIANPVKIATNPLDNSVVIAGYYLGSIGFGGEMLTNAGSPDIFIAKYNSTGQHLWSKRFGGIVGDQAQAVAVDPRNGDIMVIGEFGSTVDFDGTVLTA